MLSDIGAISVHFRAGVLHDTGQLYCLQHGDVIFRVSGGQRIVKRNVQIIAEEADAAALIDSFRRNSRYWSQEKNMSR